MNFATAKSAKTDEETMSLLKDMGTKPIEKEGKPLRVMQIFVQGRKFANLDGNRDKSDTQVTLEMKWKPNQQDWIEIDRTEVVADNLDPKYSKHFDVIYNFGQMVQLRFLVNDVDSNGKKQQIGSCQISMADLVSRASYTGIIMELSGVKNAGSLILSINETFKAQNKVTLTLQALNLPALTNIWQLNFSTTYYMEIYRGPIGKDVKIYESEWFVNDPNHLFEPIVLSDAQLCGLDASYPIQFKFICRNNFKMTDTEICSVVTNFGDLKQLSGGNMLGLIAENSMHVGDLKIKEVKLDPISGFGEYLKDGYQISLMGAIDFTFSNGVASSPQSLHFMGNPEMNQYTRVIKAVTTILNQYDTDKQYPFYGFGAIPTFMGSQLVSHCFPLNGDMKNPSILGVQTLLNTYQQILPQIKMMGPTNFAPVLRECKRQVASCVDSKMYHIILILTDGEIHDMQETIDEIVDISDRNLPCSIIVVGVGNEDFSSMVRLDGDDLALKEGIRDIVQFVKFKEVIEKSQPGTADANLATLILEEIPTQMVGCFAARGEKPARV